MTSHENALFHIGASIPESWCTVLSLNSAQILSTPVYMMCATIKTKPPARDGHSHTHGS